VLNAAFLCVRSCVCTNASGHCSAAVCWWVVGGDDCAQRVSQQPTGPYRGIVDSAQARHNLLVDLKTLLQSRL
jgi:hypothetical protein